jgi:hypothetical protein
MSLRREERKSCKRRDTLTKFITDHRPRVKNNQDSPLLRLPPELRDRIWGFAIGAHVLRVVYTNSPANKTVVKIQPPFKENRNTLALLRTCRQIYSETALLPYKSSTYSCDLWQPLSHGLRHMKRFQRAQIEDLQVELDLPWSRNPVEFRSFVWTSSPFFPDSNAFAYSPSAINMFLRMNLRRVGRPYVTHWSRYSLVQISVPCLRSPKWVRMNLQRSKFIPDQVDPPRAKHAQMEPRLVVLELYTVF